MSLATLPPIPMILTIRARLGTAVGFRALGHTAQHFLLRIDIREILRFHRRAECVGIERLGVVPARGAGTVDQYVDRAHGGADFLDDIGGAVRFVQVGARAVHVESFLFQLFVGARKVGGVARHDRDLRAFLCEGARARETDAFAAAGDEHHLISEPEFHGRYPPSKEYR
ncbi:hypothetical protein OKW37_002549 [Paraburkholderia sp. MM5482-R2]